MTHTPVIAPSSYLPVACKTSLPGSSRMLPVVAHVQFDGQYYPVVWDRPYYKILTRQGQCFESAWDLDGILFACQHRVDYLREELSYFQRANPLAPTVNPPFTCMRLDWRYREQRRMESGDYDPLPDLDIDFPADHFIHLSVHKQTDDYIAFTPSEEYGLADRQVRMKLGRYLHKYFPDMTDKQVSEVVRRFKAILERESAPYLLHFATDIPTINAIFETEMYAKDSSCTSCMYGKFREWDDRPYHVYANSPDVSVAYLTKAGDIVARTVVNNRSYKEWVRTYSIERNDSTLCTLLESMLREQGYKEGDLIGARLTKVFRKNSALLPYIDHGGMCVYDDGRYWVVTGDEGEAHYRGDNTNGYPTLVEHDDDDDDDFDNDLED